MGTKNFSPGKSIEPKCGRYFKILSACLPEGCKAERTAQVKTHTVIVVKIIDVNQRVLLIHNQ
jgi:hypothetical protein